MRPSLLCAVLAACLAGALPAAAGPDIASGRATDLPLPRYASLKTDRVNLREGPSKDHRTLWVYRRAGLPVEIIAEYETWRRIRDSEGTEGWVLHSLLSGRRTAVVTAPKGGNVVASGSGGGAPTTIPLYTRADAGSEEAARLEAGVIGSVKNCGGTWCRVIVSLPQSRSDLDGYIRQDRLWGVYPNETLD